MKNTVYGFCALACLISAPLVLGGCGGGTMPFANNGGNSRVVREQVVKAVQTGFSTYKTGKSSGNSRVRRSEGAMYDSFYELWYVTTEDGQGADYFEDEACTKPAGTSRYEQVDAGDGGSFKSTGSFNITAGPKAGAKGTSFTELVLAPEFVYSFEFIGEIPGDMTYSTSGKWDGNGGGYKLYSKDADGKVMRYECSYNNDGTSKVVFTDENDLEFTLNYNADQSGSGTITGKDTTLLPATIVWDANGTGTITFKDGSKETFENFEFKRS